MIKMMRSARFVFFSACLGILLFGITLITLGSVAPAIQHKFHLDALSSGTLFSILPFGILGGSLVFGPIADRHGYKVILLFSCIAMFIGFQGIAYAASITILKVCVFFFGFGGGAINGATNALVSDISSENKAANLSILGVFFAVGALGMPFMLGLLEKHFSVQTIVSAIGYLTLLFAFLLLFVSFPKAKQLQGVSLARVFQLLKDDLLLFIAFFLFCQSGFEGIINNWTTIYLMDKSDIEISKALYALSLYVAGIAVTRVILGTVLKKISSKTVLMISIVILSVGTVVLHFGESYFISVTGLILIGAGIAAGFPVMLGLVGARYTDVSGTAFSVVISISLVGNIIVNYGMGILAQYYGIGHLTTLASALALVMFFFSIIIFRKLNSKTINPK
ncbi:MAG: MFS transporter [Cyclobacteriaceae bacterium]|nr:MFS transporter [Cyclobacteriaceae bacterium]MDH4297717.1 MFS transporter [Cyclobacteriaceae bacterium]MDH5248817.1 MFS transporter [Cyclobacteriaceae bacterium]